ncbi:ClpX C4-type zinc finger protein [Alkalihalobacillus pseudalcaliphilus]|uniref:ClpX C4-type zinc finger protein n=1 Tax=Alkalihalobacillus pseudalcaliphilus TaxID=79884 RepID=UPI00064DA591|nr:ClpX C4-type zinc finger protein [Alkalihalobacillus pseudalcaliphilus]KMK77721.1 hypothetical protein AB990_04495 [Alkalihalobacillus pseudalcaliphilus]
MEQDFRKKTFRGAKVEDLIKELENLSTLCEGKSEQSAHIERQRFYEGMAIAYTTIAVKLKGEFDYIEPKVFDELYPAINRTSPPKSEIENEFLSNCSFCHRSKEEIGDLALGPNVSICQECLEFGSEVINS